MHEILSVLRRPGKPGCVSLLGERRIGKSSLLNQIYQALAAEPNLVSIHATAQDWDQSSQKHFYTHLQRAISAAAGQAVPSEATDYPSFRDFVHSLARDYRFMLIIDEFEEMAGNPNFDSDFFSNLRALADRPEYRFGYLISSRRPLKELCRTHDIASSSLRAGVSADPGGRSGTTDLCDGFGVDPTDGHGRFGSPVFLQRWLEFLPARLDCGLSPC
jgi:hypothetical protein